MADITKCKGVGCPLRERCYRAMASPDSVVQSWADYDVIRGENGICSFFWDMSVDDDLQDNGFPLINVKED